MSAPTPKGIAKSDLDAALGFTLSEEQWSVVDAPLEPAVVVAGAGSGKTTSMSARIAWLIAKGWVLPDQVLGLTFTEQIETVARNLWISAVMLAVFGILLGLADRFGRKEREISDMRTRDAIGLGLAQALALIPGVSRSGATITMGLTLGYTREAATRYAFLLAIQAVLGSGFYEATRMGDDPQVAWGQTIVATVIAFGVGYAVIAWLLRYLRTGSYLPFVAYRLALAALIVALLVTGTITAT